MHPSGPIPRSDRWRGATILLCLLLSATAALRAEQVILHLKNGDRVSGRFLGETNQAVTLTNTLYGTVHVPAAEISKREIVPSPAPPPVVTNAAPVIAASTNSTPKTNAVAAAAPPAAPKKKEPAGPMAPANPEATPIASTPSFWKHDLRFGLNLRYSARDSQEFSIVAKSTYGKAPFRHILDGTFRYGRLEGQISANSLSASEKTEYQISKRSYVFSLIGGGYDEVRKIEQQYELGPGFGMELLKMTNFVWKGEVGFNFQQQYRSDDTRNTVYSIRIAEIFAWRIWEKLTADFKVEYFPSLENIEDYRLRLESTLRYPVSKLLSLNLDVIDLYDTQPVKGIPENDLQIRSSIGVTF